MKFSKIILMLTLLGTILISSCKDEKDPDPSGTKTNTEKLSSGNWVLFTATFNPPLVVTLGANNFTFVNLFDIPVIDSCQKDNKIMFNADGTMTIDNGKIKCSPTEAQTAKDGNWKFANNETQIEITNSAYFSLINSTKVILNQVTVSETELKGITDYEFVNPNTQVKTTSKVSFIFRK